jgi:serine protease inhibitor
LRLSNCGSVETVSFAVLCALHFKSRWQSAFDPKLTAIAPFEGVEGRSESVAMMHLDGGTRSYRREGNFVAVNLPFSDPRFSLVVVTSTGRPARAKNFAEVADWLNGVGFAGHPGTLALPRFSVSGHEALMPVLDALGLDKARHSTTALQGLAPGAMLSQVIQRAMIDVDEQGAEAAAATAVMGVRSLGYEEQIDMIVDKPFIFALRDRVTGLILVAGYVGHAPNEGPRERH